ncbi:MAG: tetratricopeptide repeat protein [bacterium]|nr:tetratricopeptide repeat protein [bacterium]
MPADLVSQATNAALAGDWQNAADLNSTILSENPKNVEALNRLAHALAALGKTTEAKKKYQQALIVDPYNHIAKRNLEKLDIIKDGVSGKTGQAASCLFLEEPGKTKVTSVVNPAPQQVLSCLSPGIPLDLAIKKHSILILKNGDYVGALPDDLAHRLINLTRLGNKYQAYVRGIEKNNLLVFLQEVKRSKRVNNQPSFPPGKSNGFYPFVYSKQALSIDGEPPEVTPEDEDDTGETKEEEEL